MFQQYVQLSANIASAKKAEYNHPVSAWHFPFESSFVQWIATTFLQKNLSCMYSLCMDVYSASLMLSRSCALSWLFAKELVHPSLPEPARCNRTTSQTPLRFSPYLTSLWRCDDAWIFSHVPTRNLPKETLNLENRLLKMITCNKWCAILWLQVPRCFLNQNSHVVSLVDAIVLNKIRCAPPKTYKTLKNTMLSVSIFTNLPQNARKFQCSAYLGKLSFPKWNPSQLAQIWLSPLMKLCFNIHEGSNFTQVTWELQWWNVIRYVWVVGNHPQLDQLEYWSTKLWSSISTGEIEHMFGNYQLYILQMLLGSRVGSVFASPNCVK